MNDAELGRLEKVDVREKWPDEARDFTPWLSKNLDLLSKELGISLELVGTEVAVGPYWADIVARIHQNGARAVVENQLMQADPKHLGQLLTYFARRKAKVGVWVATSFWRTNLSAIQLLNKHTAAPDGFYAVRVSVYRNKNSKLVPVFEVIEHTGGWRDRRASDFWDHLAARRPDAPPPIIHPNSNFRRGRHVVKEANLKIVQYFMPDFVRVYVTGNWKEADKAVIAKIKPFRLSLLKTLDKTQFLAGDNPRCTTELKVNTFDRGNWDGMADWLDDQRMKYERVLRNGPSG